MTIVYVQPLEWEKVDINALRKMEPGTIIVIHDNHVMVELVRNRIERHLEDSGITVKPHPAPD